MLKRFAFSLAGFALLAATSIADPYLPRPTAAAAAQSQPIGSASLPQPPLEAWRADFANRMALAGHKQFAIDGILNDTTLEPRVEAHLGAQAEFTIPIWRYVQDRLSAYSVGKGRKLLTANADLFGAIQTRYGVPKEIVAAIWGMESGYGSFTGNIDAPSALATMAMRPERRVFAERQLEALISILERGYATRTQLKGSWSAAMGHTQFIPTTYLERAVDWDGDGIRDFWGKPDDALASTGNFLKVAGWRVDQPWGVEIKLGGPKALLLADSAARPLADFAKAGIRRANGQTWRTEELQREARLFLPAGRAGPSFLVFSNFDAIKEYNRSEAYALSVSLLGDALAGRQGVITPWPKNALVLSPEDVRKLQAGLTALGYPVGELDGKVGTQTRIALFTYQRDRSLPSDGFPSPEALKLVLASVAGEEKRP